MHLFGTTVDWKKDIMGEAFNFKNPNAASQCGCGTSFSI
jgi:iron-sulfur cluster assembly protein